MKVHRTKRRVVKMTINLNPEQERIIQAEIASGHFRNPEELVDHTLAALQEKEPKGRAAAPRKNLAQFLMESPFAGTEVARSRLACVVRRSGSTSSSTHCRSIGSASRPSAGQRPARSPSLMGCLRRLLWNTV